eukprot:1035732_1
MNGDTTAAIQRIPHTSYITHTWHQATFELLQQLMHIMKIESVVPAAWINTWNYLQKLAIQSVLLHLGLAMQCEKTKCVGFEAVMNALLAKKVDDLVDDECDAATKIRIRLCMSRRRRSKPKKKRQYVL